MLDRCTRPVKRQRDTLKLGRARQQEVFPQPSAANLVQDEDVSTSASTSPEMIWGLPKQRGYLSIVCIDFGLADVIIEGVGSTDFSSENSVSPQGMGRRSVRPPNHLSRHAITASTQLATGNLHFLTHQGRRGELHAFRFG